MTTTQPVPSGAAETQAGRTLAQLLAALDHPRLGVRSAPLGLNAPVRSVGHCDLALARSFTAGPAELVFVTVPLGPGVPERLRSLVLRLAEEGAAGIAVLERDLDEGTAAAAAAAGLIVLTVRDPGSWAAVGDLASHALRRRPESEPAVDLADLRAVVDAVADATDATVLITDAQLDLVAHHVRHSDCGQEISSWVLHRSIPATVRRRLAGGRLDPARDCATGLGGIGGRHWTVRPLAADGVLVGGIWTFGPNQAADRDRHEPFLRHAAQRATTLLAPRTATPATDERSERLLAGSLQGAGGLADLVAAMGIGATSGLRLVVVRASADWPKRRLLEFVRLHAAGSAGPAVAAAVGDRVYLLCPDLDSAERLAAALAPTTGPESKVRCVIGDPVADDAGLRAARGDADLLLDHWDPADLPAVSSVAGERSKVTLARLAELVEAHPGLAEGAISRLAELDAGKGTDYLPTLRAYFGTRHDLQRAADQLYVHRNTLRYRLDRISKLVGLELTDPVQELIADLQLRLHDLRARTLCTPPVVAEPDVGNDGTAAQTISSGNGRKIGPIRQPARMNMELSRRVGQR